MDTILGYLRQHEMYSMQIYGFTDGIGSDDFNLALSQKRAQRVMNYFVSNGIARERLVAKGLGYRNKMAAETKANGSDAPEGRQLNRRVEFRMQNDNPASRVSTGEEEE